MQKADVKKYIALTLATCVALGVIGIQSFRKQSDSDQPVFLHMDGPNQRLHLELNHLKSNLNEMKRLLFVKNNAPESSTVRKVVKELEDKESAINKLNSLIKKHETELADEKAKITTLATSLTALNELLDIQKKEDRAQAEAIEKSKNKEIEELRQQVAVLSDTLQSNTKLYNSSIQYGAALQDELAIKTALAAMQKQELDSAYAALHEQKMEIEFTHFKLENEKNLADEINETLLSLNTKNESILKKHELDLQEIGFKGAYLEEELALETTSHALQRRNLQQEFINEKADLKQAMLFEKLENILIQERMAVELEDLSYALIATVQQQEAYISSLEKALKNAESHLLQNSELLETLAKEFTFNQQNSQLKLELDNAHAQIALLEEAHKYYTEQLNALDSELKQHIAQLEEKHAHIVNLEQALLETNTQLQATTTLLENEMKQASSLEADLRQQIAALEEASNHSSKTQHEEYIISLESALAEAEKKLQTTASHLEGLVSAYPALENEIKEASSIETQLRQYIALLEDTLVAQENLAKEQIAHIQNVSSSYSELAQQMSRLEEALNLKESTLSDTNQKHESYISILEKALIHAENALTNTASLFENLESDFAQKVAAITSGYELELQKHKDSVASREKELQEIRLLLEQKHKDETIAEH